MGPLVQMIINLFTADRENVFESFIKEIVLKLAKKLQSVDKNFFYSRGYLPLPWGLIHV